MARPALFVLAARRRYLRRFLSPRNQQNPKRSLRKMKGAEGPGRGGPRGCGGRELASDRRRPGGERARPWGVPRSRPRGVGAEPGGPLRAAHSRSPAPRRLPPLSAALPPRPPAGRRVLGTRILLQSAFEARSPAQGQEISHLDGGGVGRGPAARAPPGTRRPLPRSSAERLSRARKGHRRTGAPPAVGPRLGERLVRPSARRGSRRGRRPHKALLWLGSGRDRVAFVPPLSPWRARLIAGPGPGAGYVPGGSTRGSRTSPGPGRAVVRTATAGPARRPAAVQAVSAGAEPEKEPGEENLFAFPTPQRALGWAVKN